MWQARDMCSAKYEKGWKQEGFCSESRDTTTSDLLSEAAEGREHAMANKETVTSRRVYHTLNKCENSDGMILVK